MIRKWVHRSLVILTDLILIPIHQHKRLVYKPVFKNTN
jgi:hypothetical protein